MSGWSAAARVRTEMPGRYMRQMCSHFGHKVQASCEEDAGEVVFPFGTCRFRVLDGRLELAAEAASEAELLRVQEVIGKHLARFAWRETPSITWDAAPVPAA
jgi:hypothetical protein